MTGHELVLAYFLAGFVISSVVIAFMDDGGVPASLCEIAAVGVVVTMLWPFLLIFWAIDGALNDKS